MLLRAVVNLQTIVSIDDPLRSSTMRSSTNNDAALSSQMHRSLARALKLAVVWDRVDVAQERRAHAHAHAHARVYACI